MQGGMQGPQDTSFYAMRKAVQQSVSIIKADPGVENVMGFTGGQGSTNGGFTFVALKPLDERDASASQIIDRLRPKLARVAGAATFLQATQDIRIGGRQGNAMYQYTLEAETPGGPRPLRAATARGPEENARLHRRQHRPAGPRPAGPAHLRPAHRRPPRPDARNSSTAPSTTPSANPKPPPSTASSTSTTSSSKSRPSTGSPLRA